MEILVNVILPVFLVIGMGYLLAWRHFLEADQFDALMKFAQNFAIPLLLFRVIAQLDFSQSFDPKLLFSFYFGAFSAFICGLTGARFLFRRDWEDSVVIGFCCLFSNSVILGLTITERAYGDQAMPYSLAIITFHAPFCYIIGIIAMEIAKSGGIANRKTVLRSLHGIYRNILIVAIALGFVVNFIGLSLPLILDEAFMMIAVTALPISLFCIGAVLYRFRPEGDKLTVIFVCAMSLIIHPGVTWLTGQAIDVPPEAFPSAVLVASMAPGVNTYVFANMYGRARRIAASAVLCATGLSILTIWVWLQILGIRAV